MVAEGSVGRAGGGHPKASFGSSLNHLEMGERKVEVRAGGRNKQAQRIGGLVANYFDVSRRKSKRAGTRRKPRKSDLPDDVHEAGERRKFPIDESG